MKKKYLRVFLFGALLVASTSTFTSCKDYDSDIDNLQEQINGIKLSVQELEALVKSGSVITSVTTNANGIVVATSDGKSYTITNGKDGAAGADATLWTIGNDGYWYKDAVKTEYKAVGVDGTNGTDGKDGVDGTNGTDGKDGVDGTNGTDGKDGVDGTNGTDGKDGVDGTNGTDGKDGVNGQYHVPNPETGNFDIYQDGEFVASTEIAWRGNGVTAIKEGNTLKFSGVEGAEDGVVTITLGDALGSVAFVPDFYSSELPLPTTSKPFYHIATYIDGVTPISSTNLKFKPFTFNESNKVDMYFRLNPAKAYVTDAFYGFINRKGTMLTRAVTGDKSDLLQVVDKTIVNEEVKVVATHSPAALKAGQNIAALQVWSGQNPVTSDFVFIATEAVEGEIANITTKPYSKYYTRDMAKATAATEDAYIKQFVPLSAEEHFTFKYSESIDLKDKVELYCFEKLVTIASLGFDNITFEFSLPSEYKANDDQKTNQQWFVELNDGVVKVNNANVPVGTAAIGRTPVVLVNALVNGKIVSSAYIKLKIAEVSVDVEDKEDKELVIDETRNGASYKYSATKADAFSILVAEKPWTQINQQIYDDLGLTAANFWNYYDTSYEMSLDVMLKTNTLLNLFKLSPADTPNTEAGVDYEVMLNQTDITTSNIKVGINNKIKTQNTYANVDGKGAMYTFTITVTSKDRKMYPNIVLEQVFYVKEECAVYAYNPIYWDTTYPGIVTKGKIISGAWNMSSSVVEHFAKVNDKNIYDSSLWGPNVTAIDFAWKIGETNVKLSGSVAGQDLEAALDAPMDKPEWIKLMTYWTTLVNSEVCNYEYKIIFKNPFVKGAADAIIIPDAIDASTGEAKTEVEVKDVEGKLIYSYDALSSSLVLSQNPAIDYYKLDPAKVTVEYAFDANNADYKTLMANIADGSILTCDATTGLITWANKGSLLVRDFNLKVMATVTFEDLSIVTCEIPVTIAKR